MSTDGFTMPFSVIFVPKEGLLNPQIPENMRTPGGIDPSIRITIPAGVSRVSITWAGPSGVALWHYRDSTSHRVGAIPAGTAGIQRYATFAVGFETESQISLAMGTAPTAESDEIMSKRRILVDVIPQPVFSQG